MDHWDQSSLQSVATGSSVDSVERDVVFEEEPDEASRDKSDDASAPVLLQETLEESQPEEERDEEKKV